MLINNNEKLFIDKYKPEKFDDIKYSLDSNIKLQSLAKITNFPHLILKGNRGCGKKTRALLFIEEKYNKKIKLDSFIMECKILNKVDKIDLNVIYSQYHYQINLSSYGIYDRHILEYFLNNIINFKSVKKLLYRIIVIEDIDLLSIEAQQSLRRTLETKITNARFIFIVNNEGYLIDPLYSRCIIINISSPTNNEIFKILHDISKKENLNLTNSDYNLIINKKSNRNIHKSITILNNYKITNNFNYDNDNNLSIQIISNIILNFTKMDEITIIRAKLTYLLLNIMNKNQLFKSIFFEILNKLIVNTNNKNKYLYKYIKISLKYDLLYKKTPKNIYSLEGFFISLIKLFNS